ncbi:hypothetical protein GCM10007276_34570 [Agaricicola taiwanensis]|uniref:Uncharacterized protein n=1 Tax=Agaricicola taiwanensis TaxID=591372 RepID=A0A8J2YMZ0_9RHOB|nr:hypothetical protein [Agaricicola taiwanensis]GGE54628.1 hypothetical protein GCM10007276_34570 [Agaricicola taiwanensis]
MSGIADLVRRLAAAGASAEVIAMAVDAVEAEGAGLAERRRAERERKRRQRASRDTGGDSAGQEVDRSPSPKKESSPTPPKEKTTPRPDRRDEAARAELTRVLDASRAGAVVAHRRAMRKALSPHAARLLAARFARCADPNAAADTMIANGWQGFEPEWLEARKARGSPHPGRSWTEALALNTDPSTTRLIP